MIANQEDSHLNNWVLKSEQHNVALKTQKDLADNSKTSHRPFKRECQGKDLFNTIRINEEMELQYDHIIPLEKGGANDLINFMSAL